MNRSSGVLLPGAGFLVGELIAPPGTRMPFNQSAAPLGWTIDASSTLADCSSVARQASGGSTGGSMNWSGWNFSGQFNLNAFTLSVTHLPSHNHTVSDPGHTMSMPGGSFVDFPNSGGTEALPGTVNTLVNQANLDAATLNASIANNGSSSSIQPSYTTPQVKYTDAIIGVRS